MTEYMAPLARMKRRAGGVTAVAICAIVSLGGSAMAGPSFDCHRPNLNAVERVICQTPEFGDLDGQIAADFNLGMTEFETRWRAELQRNQTGWLRERDACVQAPAHHPDHPGVAMSECVRMMLESRKEELDAALMKGRIGAD